MSQKLLRLNEVFYSVQGEGFHQGKDAIFVRFSGCNLWDGTTNSRVKNNTCGSWCDTDFKLNMKLTLENLLDTCYSLAKTPTLIVLTGGEPLLQVTQELIDALYKLFPLTKVCIETNGTIALKVNNCFVTVSPKENTTLTQTKGDELKIIVPQSLDFKALARLPFTYKWFQPKDSLDNCNYALELLRQFPDFRLSLQLHKLLGVR